MKKIKWLGVATAAVAMALGTSAFAESRHREGTNIDRSRVERPSVDRSQRGETRSQQQASRSEQAQTWRDSGRGRIGGERPQSFDRSQGQSDRDQAQSYRDRSSRDQQSRDPQNAQQYRDRSDAAQYGGHRGSGDRYRDRGNQDQYRGGRNGSYGRNGGSYDRYGNRGNNNYGRYDRGARSSMLREGRVERIMHERGGYRVWLGGFGFPFWIPEARWSRFPLRLGVSIRLGGWWDPLGYYDVYDVGPMGGYYNTAGDVHGVVESVDYRRGTIVMRDDISNSFVTVALRGNDPRLGDLRPGDYVDLSGQWTRGGLFEAFRLEAMNDGQYGRYGDGRY